MTTILYVKDDGLYTDSKHVRTYLPNRYKPVFRNKIIKDYKNEFAFAVTGYLATEPTNPNLHDYIRELLHQYKNYLSHKFKPNPSFIRGESEIVIITATSIHFFNKDTYADVSDLDYFAIGSGAGYAEGVMRITGNPILAINAAKNYDPLTAGEINIVKHQDLSNMEI